MCFPDSVFLSLVLRYTVCSSKLEHLSLGQGAFPWLCLSFFGGKVSGLYEVK